MSFLHRWRGRLRPFFRRTAVERELDEELRFHIEMQTEENVRAGMSLEEARRQALVLFGGVEGHREECRDARGGGWIDSTLADVRFAFRQFRRRPLSTTTMVTVLALGIGANTALFTVLHSGATLPPAGVQRDDALVRIRGEGRWQPQGPSGPRDLSLTELREFARQDELFSDVAGWSDADVLLQIGDAESGLIGAHITYVTGDYFGLLRVRPVVGAGLPAVTEGDDASSMVGLLSHSMWVQHFGGSPEVVGRTVRVNGSPITLVGVAPPQFQGVAGNRADPELWLPLAARGALQPRDSASGGRVDDPQFGAIARLRSGVAAEQATPTIRAIAARTLFGPEQDFRHDPSADVAPLLASNMNRQGPEGALVRWAATAIALLILLVTCTNVSALLIGSAASRRREISVRLSLGAPRKRLVRQLLTESSLVAVLGGALGLALLWVAVRRLGDALPDFPLAIAWPAVGFTLVIAVATGILFGLTPALHATRLSVSDVLKDSAAAVSAPRTRLQRALVVAQIALTQPLLVALGVLSLFLIPELRGGPAAELREHVASVSFNMAAAPSPRGLTREDAARYLEDRIAEMRRLRDRIAEIPGVRGAVFEGAGYMQQDLVVHPADRLGRPAGGIPFSIRSTSVQPGYFDLLDVPIVRGRDFTLQENSLDASSIIIGDELARELWGAAEPIGKRLQYTDAPASDPSSLTVVGVVDESMTGELEYGSNLIYTPSLRSSRSMLIRTTGEAETMLPVIRSVAAAAAPSRPVMEATTLASIHARERRYIVRFSTAAAAGALLALLLSAVGLYAVVAFAVGQRTREIGIRTALGAEQRRIVRMFFANGMLLTALGLMAGLPLSLFGMRMFAAQVGMAQPSMPLLAALVAAIVCVIAAVATWLPARKAASVDPLTALRVD